MCRLIVKDFLLMKGILPTFGGFVVLLTIINISKPSPILSLLPILLSFILVGSIIGLDDKYRLDCLYCSLPVRRATIVYAKYLSTGLIFLTGILLSLLVSWFLPEQILTLKGAFFVFFSFSLFFSILYPISYRFGFQLEMEVGKIFLILLLVILAIALIFLAIKNRRIFGILNLGLFGVIFVFMSIRLSVYFFKKREF